MYQGSALQSPTFFLLQTTVKNSGGRGSTPQQQQPRGLFWAMCPPGTGCIKLIALIVQLGNLSFIPLDKLLMKILNTNCQGQTPVEVFDGYFHFDNQSLITSLHFPFVLYTPNGNFSFMIFPLLIYKNVIWEVARSLTRVPVAVWSAVYLPYMQFALLSQKEINWFMWYVYKKLMLTVTFRTFLPCAQLDWLLLQIPEMSANCLEFHNLSLLWLGSTCFGGSVDTLVQCK